MQGGLPGFALDIAVEVTLHCRKARNKHINQLRSLFLTKKHGRAIANHVLEDDVADDTGEAVPMVVAEVLRDTIPTIKELASLLVSSKMHAHPELYKHFVGTLADGKLCKIPRQPKSAALASFISVNHEAHFRLELWYALGKQGPPPLRPVPLPG